jgi:F0F1-type ATP synthase membrane subunit b/b'
MNEHGIEEIISTLYEMIQDARSMPLSADKCIVERDRVLDQLDEISNMLPGELKQAKTIVESRSEVINNAKREAENILKQAQNQARQLISENEIYKQAQEEANAMMKAAKEEAEATVKAAKDEANATVQAAQDRIRELKGVTNQYVDDALKQTEQAISEALNEVRESRAKFNALVGSQNKNGSKSLASMPRTERR